MKSVSNALYKKMLKGKNRKNSTIEYNSRPVVEIRESNVYICFRCKQKVQTNEQPKEQQLCYQCEKETWRRAGASIYGK
jgi:transcription initiation factor IIE alpha subunit